MVSSEAKNGFNCVSCGTFYRDEANCGVVRQHENPARGFNFYGRGVCPSPSLIFQRPRRTLGLTRRVACPKPLDQLSFLTPIRRMTEHPFCPPHGNVLLNPSLQNFPRSRVKKPLYGAEYFDCPLLIAVPK